MKVAMKPLCRFKRRTTPLIWVGCLWELGYKEFLRYLYNKGV
ncbi:hypothetical protein M6B38_395615 [Iris pallida]|uniref:Uncharacterized protein n=1 Tax=Iris pallida TaxID=29817 RepID=A0AAX6FX96_IRIPA|nr:hypothetical protein M6B38_395615 [Iris pallida]